MMHSYHPIAENYDRKQILHDHCGECKRRSENVALAIREMDGSTFERAWKRAYDLEAHGGDREAVGIVSEAEKPILATLWALQVEFERRGLKLDGDTPHFITVDVSSSTLPGPYRICPDDGNAYRVESEQGPVVMVTDVFGGHGFQILRSEFERWILVETEAE